MKIKHLQESECKAHNVRLARDVLAYIRERSPKSNRYEHLEPLGEVYALGGGWFAMVCRDRGQPSGRQYTVCGWNVFDPWCIVGVSWFMVASTAHKECRYLRRDAAGRL